MFTSLADPFLCMSLQRAVQKVGSQPVKGVTGVVAPIDHKIFRCIHRMLVAQLPIPRAGQGISMSRHGDPVMKTGMRGGITSYGFDITVTEVVASVTLERSWVQRANAVSYHDSYKMYSGPVFHHLDGCIGCVAAPMCFTYKPRGKYAGLTVGTMSVKHDYFVLDIGGAFRGMGRTPQRDEDAAVLNRVMLCKHANLLRSRGARFTEAQNATIDLHLQAVLRSLPVEDDLDAEEEGEENLQYDDSEAAKSNQGE